jgi:hypothetical protein
MDHSIEDFYLNFFLILDNKTLYSLEKASMRLSFTFLNNKR